MVVKSDVKDILEIYTMMEEGATAPIRVGLSDGTIAIAKYPNNSCGNQVLVNEFVCSCIAKEINLYTPRFGVCNLSADIIYSLGSESTLEEYNSGLCFYTDYIANSVPITIGPLMSLKNIDFNLEQLILFDHIIGNHERHAGNLILDIVEKKIYAIDHGTIFTKSIRYSLEDLLQYATKELLQDNSILRDNAISYELLSHKKCLDSLRLQYEAQAIKDILTSQFFQKIKENIPKVWINLMGSDTISRLLGAIQYRVAHIDELVEMIIRERRES